MSSGCLRLLFAAAALAVLFPFIAAASDAPEELVYVSAAVVLALVVARLVMNLRRH